MSGFRIPAEVGILLCPSMAHSTSRPSECTELIPRGQSRRNVNLFPIFSADICKMQTFASTYPVLLHCTVLMTHRPASSLTELFLIRKFGVTRNSNLSWQMVLILKESPYHPVRDNGSLNVSQISGTVAVFCA